MSLLKLNTISKCYQEGKNALTDISLTIKKGERIGIVGETGSGKSTLLKVMAGLEQPDNGSVTYKGEAVKGPAYKLVPGHDAIAYLHQHFTLPKFINVREHLFGFDDITKKEEKIIEACHVTHLLGADTRELSGGEKQRVAIAKKLLEEPQVLLLDEPFSNLDYHHKQTMKLVIKELASSLRLTLIMITHDAKDILPWADQVFVMRAGTIVQQGVPNTIYYQPVNEYVAGLLGSYSLLDPKNWPIDTHAPFIIRPNQLLLSKKTKHGNGTVKSVLFMGTHDEVIIETSRGEVLIAQSENDLYKEADPVFVELIEKSKLSG